MKIKILLFSIIILSGILRIWNLNNFPAGLNADEASIGYNAYSLLTTGRDEYGKLFPLTFKSFGDYKPGLYFYTVIPFVATLGLNELAVRLPSALFGIGTVLLIFFLGKEIFKNKWVGLLSSFLLAISPWHLHFSRGGWETNAATFFITCGVWLFLKAIKNPKFFAISFSFFVLSLYSYHAARIVVPLLVLGLFVIYRKEISVNIKWILVSVLIGLILLIPLGLDLTKGTVFTRAGGVGLFADTGPIERINEQRGEHRNLSNPFAVFLHNKPINYTLAFFENWENISAESFYF